MARNAGNITVNFEGRDKFYRTIYEIEDHICKIKRKMIELENIELSLEVALNSAAENTTPETISKDQT